MRSPASFRNELRPLLGLIHAAVCIAVIGAGSAGAADQAPAPADSTPVAAAAASSPPTPELVSPAPPKTCERFVAALLGDGDRALLDDATAPAIAAKVPELVACGAMLTDSDAVCKQLRPPMDDCSTFWAIFHALRTNPSAGFLLPDSEYERCRSDKMMAPFCDGLRAAAKAHDPSLCTAGGLNTFCRAIVALDPAVCNRINSDDVKAFSGVTDPAQGVKALQEQCRAQVAQYAHFATGLAAMAKASKSPEREFAKAALGEKDACKKFQQKALQVCRALPAAKPGAEPNPPVNPPHPPAAQ
ncbi:MAG: hypothetical protein ABI629_13915 [bacterium]